MSFDDLLTPKLYRWPKKGDLPFRGTGNSDVAGPLARDQLTRTVSIMGGFMLAGTTLADRALKDTTQRYDLVYPMLFCYRHAIETGLKWLITQYGPPLNVMPEGLDDTHNLLICFNRKNNDRWPRPEGYKYVLRRRPLPAALRFKPVIRRLCLSTLNRTLPDRLRTTDGTRPGHRQPQVRLTLAAKH